MNRFRPNLEAKGRVIRAVGAVALAAAAAVAWPSSRLASVGLATTAAFLAFEAGRGWCALRACGLKTKF